MSSFSSVSQELIVVEGAEALTSSLSELTTDEVIETPKLSAGCMNAATVLINTVHSLESTVLIAFMEAINTKSCYDVFLSLVVDRVSWLIVLLETARTVNRNELHQDWFTEAIKFLSDNVNIARPESTYVYSELCQDPQKKKFITDILNNLISCMGIFANWIHDTKDIKKDRKYNNKLDKNRHRLCDMKNRLLKAAQISLHGSVVSNKRRRDQVAASSNRGGSAVTVVSSRGSVYDDNSRKRARPQQGRTDEEEPKGNTKKIGVATSINNKKKKKTMKQK